MSDVDLRELFANLLAKASNSDTVGVAHPGFINVINSLSPDEAKLLVWLKANVTLPFVAVSVGSEEKDSWARVEDFQFSAELSTVVRFADNFAAYASNLEGLGLIEVSRTRRMPNEAAYDAIERRLEKRFANFGSWPDMKEIRFERGIVGFTRYGWLFCNACVA